MTEKPEDAAEYERERRESTDLGYRDTAEEEAYEHAEEAAAEGETPEPDEPTVGGG